MKIAVSLALASAVSVCPAIGQDIPLVTGYQAVVKAPRELEYPNFMAKEKGAFAFHRTKLPLVWQSGMVAEARDTVFVFIGGQHHAGQYELLVNGVRALSFRSGAKERTLYCGPRARLLFDVRGDDEQRGYLGVYYLWVPGELIKAGEPQTFTAKPITGEQRSWFAVWYRDDAVELERKGGKLKGNIGTLRSFGLTAPERVDHAVGARVPLGVTWRADVAGEYRVEALVKDIFMADFPTLLGRRDETAGAGEMRNTDLLFVCREPEPMVWIFQTIVKRGNEALIHMETDTLLGSEREDIVTVAKQKPVEPYRPSVEVKTAAFPFLKPAARGRPLRAFFMTPTNYDREVIELAQRMDLDFRTTFCYSRELKRPAGVKMQKAIEEADPECLVVSAMFWSAFAPELRKMILTRVAEGMGLVYINPTKLDKPLQAAMKLKPLTVGGVTRGVPLEETGLLEAYGEPDRWIHAAQFGEGRIVLIDHICRFYKRGWSAGIANFIPRRHAPMPKELSKLPFRQDHLHYIHWRYGMPEDPFFVTDGYSYAFLVRAMAWAASTEGAGIVRSVAVSSDAAVVEAEDAPATAKVTCRVRDRFGRVVLSSEPASVKGGRARVDLRGLNSGRHFIDAQLTDGQARIVDFYSRSFDAPSGPLVIRRFQPQRLHWAEGEKPTFDIELEHQGAEQRRVRLELTLEDGWGRELLRESREVDGTDISWQTDRPPICGSFIFRAHLRVVGTSEYASCFITFPDDQRYRDEFAPQFWGGPFCKQRDWLRLAREHGFGGAHIRSFAGAFSGARMAIEHFVPLYARRSKDEEGKLREINLDVPEVRERLDRLMDAKLKYTRPFGLHGYSLGHEASLSHVESSTHVVDYDFSEPTLAKFRIWLKARYQGIAALNESWGTRYQSFDEIVPRTYAESRDDRGNLAPWMEHRKFMDEDFTSWLTYCAGRIRKVDPEARVGITGIAAGYGSFNGIDPYLLAKQFDYSVQYSSRRIPLRMYLRYKQPGSVMGVFTGYDYSSPNEIYNKSEPWRYLFLGCTEISYYTFASFHSTGDPAGFFEPDMTLSPSGRWMSEALKEIMAGPSKLLHEKPRQHHGVGIYFSQSSIHGTTGLGIPVFVQLTRVQDAILQNLERFGLSPTVLASREVEQNPECLREFKALFFPLCTNLSDAEMSAIEEFVRNGGVAFVDPFFGVQDEAGHWRLERVPWFAQPRGDMLAATREPQEVRGTVSLSVGGDDQSVTVASYRGIDRRLRGGKPAAGVQSERSEFFVERTGLGRGSVCNVSFFIPSSEAMALWLRQRVEEAGVTPVVVIRDKDGRLVDNVQVSHIEGQDKHYFGVVYGTRAGRVRRTPATLTWPAPAHAYDVRRGQYLGRVARWETELDPVSPVLLCRLSKRVQDFSIDASTEPGEPVKSLVVTIRQPADTSRLLCHVRLETPDGKMPLPLQQKVWAQPTATVRFPIALNDPAGQWKVHVREVVSGQCRTVEREVRE